MHAGKSSLSPHSRALGQAGPGVRRLGQGPSVHLSMSWPGRVEVQRRPWRMPEQQVEVKKERSWRMKGAGEGGSSALFMQRWPWLGRRESPRTGGAGSPSAGVLPPMMLRGSPLFSEQLIEESIGPHMGKGLSYHTHKAHPHNTTLATLTHTTQGNHYGEWPPLSPIPPVIS